MKLNKRDIDRLKALANGEGGQHAPQRKPRAKSPRARVYVGPTEAQVAKACLAYLTFRGVYTLRTNAGAAKIGKDCVRGAPAGTADRLGRLPGGRFLAVEFKRPGELPRRDQVDYLIECNRDGGFGFWADNLDDFRRILDHALGGGSVRVSRHGKVTLI